MPSAWGSAIDQRLIELVRENPLLYDPSHAKYKSVDTREVTWQKIGDALHRPARRCKLRWINIRDMMKKKIKARLRYPKLHFKKYRYEKSLEFMIPHFKDTNTSDDFYYEDNPETEGHTNPFDSLTEEQEYKPILNLNRVLRDGSGTREMENSNNLGRELTTTDPIDVFLLTVGSTLRKFSPYYLNQAKGKIFQIVQDYELEQLMRKHNQAQERFGKRD